MRMLETALGPEIVGWLITGIAEYGFRKIVVDEELLEKIRHKESALHTGVRGSIEEFADGVEWENEDVQLFLRFDSTAKVIARVWRENNSKEEILAEFTAQLASDLDDDIKRVKPLARSFFQLIVELHRRYLHEVIDKDSTAVAIDALNHERNIETREIVSQSRDTILGAIRKLSNKKLLRSASDYSIRIDNFIQYYVGTQTSPSPFGGRDDELARLNNWLNSDKQFMMLAAPAGRGKSALLVRWILQLNKHKYSLAFVPISVRFSLSSERAVFEALAQQLGEHYGEPQGGVNLTGSQWKNVCHTLLSRPLPEKQIVIILDGIDEATDWEADISLMPLNLPENVRIIASARYQSGDLDAKQWCNKLGWARHSQSETLDLIKLDQTGIADALSQMGIPLSHLADERTITKEIYRLSDGEPLLIELYVRALSHRDNPLQITAPELRTIEPGLRSFIETVWAKDLEILEGREEEAAHLWLDILSMALGPIDRTDIEALSTHTDLRWRQLKNALSKLRRFVIGDGEQTGYSFGHPALRDYFYDEMGLRELTAWNKRFLDFGRKQIAQLNEGDLLPNDVSPYMLRHYSAHLQRANAKPELFYQLMSEGWLRAWEKYEGSYGGWLTDVGRARKVADSHQEISLIVKADMCRASVIALSDQYEPHILARAAVMDVISFSQAVAIIQEMSPHGRNVTALGALITFFEGRHAEELLTMVLELDSETEKVSLLCKLAPYLPTDIHLLLPTIYDIGHKADLFIALKPYISEVESDQIISTLQDAERNYVDISLRTKLIGAIFPYMPERDKARVANSVFGALPKNISRFNSYLLSRLSQVFPIQVIDYVETLPDEYSCLPVLARAAIHLDDIKQKNKIVERVFLKIEAELGHLKIERVSGRLQANMEEMEKLHSFGDALKELAPFDPIRVLGLSRNIHDLHYRAYILTTLIPYIPEQVYRALADYPYITRPYAQAVAHLIPYLPTEIGEDLFNKTFSVFREIRDDRAYCELLKVLGTIIPAEVEIVAGKLRSEVSRMQVTVTLLEHLQGEKQQQIVNNAIEMAHEVAKEEVARSGWGLVSSELLNAVSDYVSDKSKLEKSERKSVTDNENLLSMVAEKNHKYVLPLVDELSEVGRDELFPVLSSRLSKSDFKQFAQNEFERAMRLDTGHFGGRSYALKRLAPVLPQEVLQVLPSLSHTRNYVELAESLIPFLSVTDKQKAIELTLRKIQSETDARERAIAYSALAKYIPARIHNVVEQFVGREKGRILAAVIPNLHEAYHLDMVDEMMRLIDTGHWGTLENNAPIVRILLSVQESYHREAWDIWLNYFERASAYPRHDYYFDLISLLDWTLSFRPIEERFALAANILDDVEEVRSWFP